jgi:hypothetical protein
VLLPSPGTQIRSANDVSPRSGFDIQSDLLSVILKSSRTVHERFWSQDTARSVLGACPSNRRSNPSESDSSLDYEQALSPLEYRSDAASAAECAGLRAQGPRLAVYRWAGAGDVPLLKPYNFALVGGRLLIVNPSDVGFEIER